MSHFIRLLQFVFLVLAILFVTVRAGLAEEIALLKENPVAENFLPIAAVNTALWGIFYPLLRVQRSKITRTEEEIERLADRRQ
jgi:hypothetical protein